MKKQNHTSYLAPRTSQRGITLIALIITIIVMLILVGVTINVALNGGLFSKAEEATTKTKIAQIQEALTLKKAEVLADYDGKAPEDYGITIDNLNLSTELKTEYRSKLIISKDAKLYYDASIVTNTEEQNLFKSMGIEEYTENSNGTEVPEFYGVGYWVQVEGITMKYYFLENNVLLQSINNGHVAVKYTKNENNIKFGEMSAVLDEYYQTCTIVIDETTAIATRNENDIYIYNPTYDNTNKLYLNAFYLDEQSDEMLFISEVGVSDFTGAAWPISNISEISTDGRQVTYKGNIYTLVEEI